MGATFKQVFLMVDFLVLKVLFAYKAILRRPFLRMSSTVVSVYHLMMKFPIDDKVGELRGLYSAFREYYFNSPKD